MDIDINTECGLWLAMMKCKTMSVGVTWVGRWTWGVCILWMGRFWHRCVVYFWGQEHELYDVLWKLCMACAFLMHLQVCVGVCELKALHLLLLLWVCGGCFSLSVGNMCLCVFRLCKDVWETYVESVHVWVWPEVWGEHLGVCWKGFMLVCGYVCVCTYHDWWY